MTSSKQIFMISRLVVRVMLMAVITPMTLFESLEPLCCLMITVTFFIRKSLFAALSAVENCLIVFEIIFLSSVRAVCMF